MSTLAAPAPIAPPPVLRRDFPTWLPAMLVKELRQGLHARGFVGAFVGFQLIMALIGVFAVAGGVGSDAFNILQTGYWVMMAAQLLVVTPMRGLMGLQSEIEARSIDLLLLTRLTAWRIVFGKWISLLAQAALLTIALLPYGVVRYFFGSVNLGNELAILLQLFLASAVVTAGALWTSALPKIARVVFGIGLVFVWQALPVSLNSLLNSVFSGRRASGMPSGAFGFAVNWPLYLDVALILVGCLIGAVRKLAPPVENFAPLFRALPIVAALPAIVMTSRNAEGQLAFAAVLAVAIAMLELGRVEEPLAVHWRTWSRRGWPGRLIGRFVQPGWASAFEWMVVLAAAAFVLSIASPSPDKVGRVIVLGATALAFPALLLSFAGPRYAYRSAGYGLILGACSVIAAFAANAAMGPRGSVADLLLHTLPISGFWMSTNFRQAPTGAIMMLQMVVAALVLAATWWRSRPYHLQRILFDRPAAGSGTK